MKITINYCCMDCGNLISLTSAIYSGNGRCKSCSRLGKLNWNRTHGKSGQYDYDLNKKYKLAYNNKYPWMKHLIALKKRCNSKNPKYYRYNGRGIKALITSEEIKELWFRDKVWLLKQPSIDRIDNDGNYTYDNCQFIEMNENTAKDKRWKIGQYSIENNLIKIWKSLQEIEKILKFDHSHISRSVKSNKLAYGFIWKILI